MRILLSIFILTLSFQSWTMANDFKEFQIEGMSIGDSALDFFSEKKIKKNIRNWYKNKNIIGVEIKISSNKYDKIQIHYRTNDKTYKMIGINGLKFYRNNIKECYKKQNEVVKELKDFFPNIKPSNQSSKHSADKSGKSKVKYQSFHLKSKDIVSTACFDWSKEMKYNDHLRVGLVTKELNDWYSIAYK